MTCPSDLVRSSPNLLYLKHCDTFRAHSPVLGSLSSFSLDPFVFVLYVTLFVLLAAPDPALIISALSSHTSLVPSCPYFSYSPRS